MRAKALQFGKALSAALFVLLLTVAGTKNALAQTLVATLQHGDDISFYYGSDALRNAHEAAENGDIITLSSGSFASPVNNTIDKAITLRGAGCVADSISGVQPTKINDCYFHIEDEELTLTVEGIYFSNVAFGKLYHPKFVKCNIDFIGNNSWDSWVYLDNAQFTNCKFGGFRFAKTHNTTFINCVIWYTENTDNSDITITAFNSIIRLRGYAEALSAYNCIFTTYDWGAVSGYSVAYNCIGIKMGYNSLFDVTTYDCVEYNELSDVFETFEGFENDNFDFTEPFVLKEEIATGFLGNDGTEVGIHGGFMPYTSRPSYQIVRQYNVPNKSDAQGHMNVGIELYSGDE